MIEAIAKRKYWEIVVAGVLCSVTVVLLLAFAGRWASYTWPAAGVGVQVAYFVISAAAAWIVTGIFVEAAFYKARRQRLQALLDEVMDDIAGYYEELAIDLEEKEAGRG